MSSIHRFSRQKTTPLQLATALAVAFLAAAPAGAAGNERRVVNLATAVNPTDAVNLGQLQALMDRVDALEALLNNHTHSYSTGKGRGNNTKQATTGPPMAP